jgi:hypothetical protein
MDRRQFLTGSVGGMLCLTGCLQSSGGDESGESTDTPAGTDTETATPQSPFPSDSCLASMTENVPDPLYGFEFSAGSSPEVGGVTAATSGSATVGDGIATFPQAGGEIRVADVQAIDDMTVSLFARPAVAATDQWNVMLWYSPPDIQWSGWGVEHGQGAVDFWVEGPEEASTEVLTESSSPLPTGTWTHIMGVKRGTTTTLYVDGQQAATSDFPSGSISYGDADSIDMILGRHAGSGTGNRYYQGDLDSVAIWDQALSTDQIDTLLSTGSSCR